MESDFRKIKVSFYEIRLLVFIVETIFQILVKQEDNESMVFKKLLQFFLANLQIIQINLGIDMPHAGEAPSFLKMFKSFLKDDDAIILVKSFGCIEWFKVNFELGGL